MKTAKIIPIFKSGQKDVFTNYRPVSLLCQFSKILEKIVIKRLDKFIEKFNLLAEGQYGFRNNRSTSMALLDLMEEITNSIDNKKHMIGVFIDLKKAFDTIDHSILLKKLEIYGIRGATNDWFRSYLTGRNQIVSVKGCASGKLTSTCGVPQGSILGPILFIVYINDMCNISEICKYILFADDTNIFCSHANAQQLQENMNAELLKLKQWFQTNKLSLNITKTNYMLVGNKKIENPCIQIDHQVLTRVEKTKFLGVTIDDQMTWKQHIQIVQSKISRILGMMYKTKAFLNSTSLKYLYTSLILPHLMYCAEVWGNTYFSNLKCLYLAQKRALRIIFGINIVIQPNTTFTSVNF